jgi:hypothetical protein
VIVDGEDGRVILEEEATKSSGRTVLQVRSRNGERRVKIPCGLHGVGLLSSTSIG